MLNKFLAVIKIIFLLVLVGAGGYAAKHAIYVSEGYGECGPVVSKTGAARAFLLVIFSFEGWENANFVSH